MGRWLNASGDSQRQLLSKNTGVESLRSSGQESAVGMPCLWSEAGWTLLAGLLTAAVFGVILLLTPGEFWRDDTQSSLMPAYTDMHRALEEGNLPLISPSSWIGGRLGSEHSSIFSVFHLGVILVVFRLGLTLPQTANAIVLIYLCVHGAGAFRLGRATGLTSPNALIVSFTAALNGYILGWACSSWISILLSTAWLAWLWWGLLLAADPRRGRWRFVPAGLFLYLLLTGGFPHTTVMAAIVMTWVALSKILTRTFCRMIWRLFTTHRAKLAVCVFVSRTVIAKVWPMAAAAVLGVALASPALLLFLDGYRGSARSGGIAPSEASKLAIPASAAPALVLPSIPTRWRGFSGVASLHPCYEVYCGLVPAVALMAVLISGHLRFLRRHSWDLGLLLVAVVLCSYGYWGAFRWPFRWLPLFHLTLGLLGAHALQEWPRLKWSAIRQPLAAILSCLGCWGALLIFATRELAVLRFHESAHKCVANATFPAVFASTLDYCVTAFEICIVWVILDVATRRLQPLNSWIAPVIMALAIVWTWPFQSEKMVTPQWQLREEIRQAGDFDSRRLYFMFASFDQVYSRDGENGLLRRFGDTAMYAGIKTVNGYANLTPSHIQQLLPMEWSGFMNSKQVGQLLPKEAGPSGLLQMMGVDGILLTTDYAYYTKALEQLGWKVVRKTDREVLLHWPGPPLDAVRSMREIGYVRTLQEAVAWIQRRGNGPCIPIIASNDPQSIGRSQSLQPVHISAIDDSRLTVRCHVENPSRQRWGGVLYSRAWYDGYSATLNGEPLEVVAVNGLQPAVLLPPGARGELVLKFAPASMYYGLILAIVGALLAVAAPIIVTLIKRLSFRA